MSQIQSGMQDVNPLDYLYAQAEFYRLAHPYHRKYFQIQSNVGATTFDRPLGMSTPSTGGTLSNNDGSNGPKVRFLTAASAGAQAYLVTTEWFRREWKSQVAFRIVTYSAATSVRLLFGFSDFAPGDSDTTGIQSAAFWFSSTAGHTDKWHVYCRDSGGTISSPELPLAYTPEAVYQLGIRFTDDGSAEFWDLDARNLLHTERTRLPDTDTPLLFVANCFTQGASARGFDFSSARFWTL